MSDKKQNHATFDQASTRLPVFIAGGLLAGLLVGVVLGNIPYGVAGGILLAPIAWYVGYRKRN